MDERARVVGFGAVALLALTAAVGCGVSDGARNLVDSAGQGASSGDGGGGASGGSAPATACGDGVVDPGETCDDGEETASCNANCTAAVCGDSIRNASAGEGCDDGNTSDGDACDPSCQPSVMLLDGPVQDGSGYGRAEVVALESRFATAWVRPKAGGPLAFYRLFEKDGRLASDEGLGSMGSSSQVRMGSNAAGEGLAVWSTSDGLVVRAIATDGALAAPVSVPHGAVPFFLASAPQATPDGRFCLLSTSGNLRCTTSSGSMGPEVVLSPPPWNDTYHVDDGRILMRDGGMVAAYTASVSGMGNINQELRVLALDPAGSPQTEELPLAQIWWGHVAGGWVRADGTFGVALATDNKVMWFPFHASGQLDATNVVTVLNQQIDANLIAHESGRIVATWRTVASKFENGISVTTCGVYGQVMDEHFAPVGQSFTIYEPTIGDCALSPSVALNADGDLMAIWSKFVSGPLPLYYSVEAVVLPGVVSG